MNSLSGNSTLGSVDDLVAVVGMACRLPGGNTTPDAYWDFLLKKGCGIREIPSDRWNVETFYDPNPDAIAKSVSKWGGFLDDIRQFDAGFFGISPREAASMDPQQRLLLQAAYEAIQDSATPLEQYQAKKTGVFVGISQSDYRTLQEMRPTNPEAFAGTGYALCINANRVSHRLNLSGPSFAVDTACSSSLVAMHEALQSLASGASDRAIVAGVNILAHPSSFIAFSRAGMLSNTGVVSTFDENANGFVRGEGVGVVILKPYVEALHDGDRIHGVIHATHCNQDGRTSTITAPSQDAQIAMLEGLLEKANVDPEQIGYVEAHGTGTPVGDPIEAGAIGRVIGQNAGREPVLVGSGKANVGHGESAAGITGFIKTMLSARNKTVAPNINFKSANPYIPFDALNLRVPTKPEAFPENDGMRIAVVNSFGFGGTNASALISSAPPEPAIRRVVPARRVAENGLDRAHWPLFFPISAGTPEGVFAEAAQLLAALKDKKRLKDVPLEQLSASLAQSQSHKLQRAVLLVRTKKELVAALTDLASGDADKIDANPRIRRGQVTDSGKLCFMFAGQGSQWWGMARQFMQNEPIFARAVEDYDAHFVKAAGWSIKEELLRDEGTSRIDDTTVTQPALFAIQSGLAALWRHVGVTPEMVVGHSIGEAAASYVAGGISLEGAARFLSKRGAIRDQLGAKGAMAAIGLALDDVKALLPEHGLIGIAAVNGPGSVTISGDYDAIHDFVEEFSFAQPDTFIRILKVDTAWHSYQLEAGEDWFRNEVQSIDWQVPQIPFISTVTGKPETRFDIEYGWQNLRQPVMFQSGIETALDLGATTFVELGPHATLAGPATSTALEKGARVSVLNSISRKEADFDAFARAMADLFVAGQSLDWRAITGESDSGIALPKPAWAQEEHWSESEEVQKYLKTKPRHPFVGRRVSENHLVWQSEFNTKAYPFLKDHRLQSDKIFPGAGYIDMIVHMGHWLYGDDSALEVENAEVLDALFMADEAEIIFESFFDQDRKRAELQSRLRGPDDEWTVRSRSFLRPIDFDPPKAPRFDPEAKSVKEIPVECAYDVDSSLPFVNYGPAFQVIDRLWMTRGMVVAKLTAPDEILDQFDEFEVHPALLDGCLQLCDPRMTPKRIRKARQAGDPIYLPIGARRMRFFATFPKEVMVYAKHIFDPATLAGEAEFVVTDMDGTVLATAEGLEMKALPTKAADALDTGPTPQFARQVLTPLRDAFEPAPQGSKPWVVVGAPSRFSKGVVAALDDAGIDTRFIDRSKLGDTVSEALEDALGEDMAKGAVGGIIYTDALQVPVAGPSTSPDALFGPINDTVTDLIALGDFVEFHRGCEDGLARVVVLTSGAYPDAGAWAKDRALSQSPILAVTRVIASELPEYDVRHADFAPDAMADFAPLVDYILSETDETEVIIAPDGTLVPRLQKVEADAMPPQVLDVHTTTDETNFHATMRAPGAIDDLDLWELPNAPVGPDQVRVRVAAVGLNFRDIMAVTGLLPEEAEPDPAWQHLGLEFGGVVDAVGENVTAFKPGDRVMGMQRRCLQRFMVLDPIALTPVPDQITLEEAATIPSAFATAHYALNHVGRMQEGEKVFIHVATGGVGTAAVQLAQAAGAEIFATAGSPKKRRILKDLGVPHIMSSRSLKFADDVRRITNGEGVDVLLNSLPEDYITKGLDIMAPYGRFLEIGKRDVYSDSSIGMRALRKNVSLSVLDLAAMGQERPKLLAGLMTELVEKFQNGDLRPLPLTAFPISQIADAFRFMSQAKHVGKVVVTLDEPVHKVRRDVNRPVSLRGDAAYLVTGGTSGFGLTIADWLSRAGAGKLYLASRSGAVGAQDTSRLDAITDRGTQVEVVSLDVTDATATDAFVAGAATGDTPLVGAVHAAALFKDGFITQLTPDMISDVLRPKVIGGWALHQAFENAGIQTEFMVGFSSIAQMIGSGGQANYVAANAFLEALAAYQRSHGQPGVAINWGAMGESGFVARNEGLANYLEYVGLAGLSDAETDLGMEMALSRDVGQFVYASVDWAQLAQANRALGRSARFAPMLRKDAGGSGEVRARLMTLTGDALLDAAKEFIVEEVSSVLKVDPGAIQTDRQMSELGLDSLSSFELKMRVESALDFMLPVSKFLQAPSIDELSKLLADEVTKMVAAEAAAAQNTDGDATSTQGAQTAQTVFVASNAQDGAIALSTAPMSSVSVKAAQERSLTLDVPAELDDAELAKILRKLARRHPMLSLQFPEGDTPGQIAFDRTLGIQTGDPLAPLDIASGELVRVSRIDDQVTLCLHRSVADGPSLDVLAKDLTALVHGTDLPRVASAKSVKTTPARLRRDPELPQSQTDQAFFYYSLADGAAAVPFDRRTRALLPLSLGQDQGPAQSKSGTCTDASEAQMMTAFAQAIRAATDSTGRVLMARAARPDHLLPKAPSVGPWTILQPVLVSSDADDAGSRHKLERVLDRAASHASFDCYAAAEAFAVWFDTWHVTPLQIGFDACTAEDLDRPVVGTQHDVLLQVADGRYRLIYDADVVTKDQVNKMAKAFEKAVKPAKKTALSKA